MFIHFGMNTFECDENYGGKAPASLYNPDALDVDQWVSVARDAGMKYIVLTAKHTAGHCLWPSRHTKHTVAYSGNKTDVVEAFVKSCEKRGIMPGFYYCSWDSHNRFGSMTFADPVFKNGIPSYKRYNFNDPTAEPMDPNVQMPFTTSIYQNFQTAQIRELLTQYGPIGEVWIDIPAIMGEGYRTFLYGEIARLQPQTVIMMNSGVDSGENYDVDCSWPSDLIAMERNLPPGTGHKKWRTIAQKQCYLPGEICDTIGKEWFFVEGDKARSDEVLASLHKGARQRGANLLLNIPPNKHGVIPDEHVDALTRLRKNAAI
jgi:alpha-L-fucosidase